MQLGKTFKGLQDLELTSSIDSESGGFDMLSDDEFADACRSRSHSTSTMQDIEMSISQVENELKQLEPFSSWLRITR